MLAGSLEKIERPVNIRLRVFERLLYRRADACSRGEVDNAGDRRLKRPSHDVRIADVALNQAEAVIRRQIPDVATLDARVIVWVEVVDPDHSVATRNKRLADV